MRRSSRNWSSRTYPIITPPRTLPIYSVNDTEDSETILSNHTAELLMSLITQPLSSTRSVSRSRLLPLGSRALEAFFQPVVVRPTQEQLDSFTILGSVDNETCAICQEQLTADQEGRKLNACGHWFHRSCIDIWFERDVHCPVCRHDIREPRVPSRRVSIEDEENDEHKESSE